MAWQAIDTAPRDGTPVDLWVIGGNGGYRVADCWYSRGEWRQSDSFLSAAVEHFPHVMATHWMPAPKVPASQPFAWRDAPVPAVSRPILKSTVTHTAVVRSD